MPRLPTLRRPVIDIMARQLRGIARRQESAERAGHEYELTEKDMEALDLASTVAAKLERKGPDEDEEKPVTEREKEDALKRLEAGGPPTAPRVADDDDRPK